MKKIILCPKCQTDSLVKNGKTSSGKQKYYCNRCGAYGSTDSSRYSEEQKEEILRVYRERASLRGIHRIYGTAITTVLAWLKKKQNS
jgi:transposase-like protein